MSKEQKISKEQKMSKRQPPVNHAQTSHVELIDLNDMVRNINENLGNPIDIKISVRKFGSSNNLDIL